MFPEVTVWNLFVRRAIAEATMLLCKTHAMPDWYKRKLCLLGSDNHHRMEVEDAFSLVVERYLILALKEKGFRFGGTEVLEGMPIRNMRVQCHHFIGPANEDVRCHTLVTDPLTVQPMECLTATVLTAGATKGCRNCRFQAKDCSYCLDGRLREMLCATGKFQPFDLVGWPTLKAGLGLPYSDCLEEFGRFEMERLQVTKGTVLKAMRLAIAEEKRVLLEKNNCPWRKMHLKQRRDLKKAIQALRRLGQEPGEEPTAE